MPPRLMPPRLMPPGLMPPRLMPPDLGIILNSELTQRRNEVSEEDLKAWMNSPVVIHVLNIGIDDSRIKMALRKHGKLYTDANTLATAALSMQMEEQVRMIPSQNPESQDTTPRPARSESAPCPPSTSVQLQNEDPATSRASGIGKCIKIQDIKQLKVSTFKIYSFS